MKHEGVFLDRDGTLIPDHGYLDNVDGVELLPGVGTALAQLMRHGFQLVLVTNQSGIGRGYFDAGRVDAQHRRLAELLAAYEVRIERFEVCPHTPDAGCACRKPEPGLLLRAAAACQVDPSRSFMVGDKESDILAGNRSGCTTILVGRHCSAAHAVAPDLAAAVRWILRRAGKQ